jgi:hypothetical protein
VTWLGLERIVRGGYRMFFFGFQELFHWWPVGVNGLRVFSLVWPGFCAKRQSAFKLTVNGQCALCLCLSEQPYQPDFSSQADVALAGPRWSEAAAHLPYSTLCGQPAVSGRRHARWKLQLPTVSCHSAQSSRIETRSPSSLGGADPNDAVSGIKCQALKSGMVQYNAAFFACSHIEGAPCLLRRSLSHRRR